ncbi:glycine cleavage system t protein [Acrodontium crateriforme]|uniref:Aminomethyltransferase n=1 Tax=Acrodontium crateriforme TaxID=150365 RepID=A0AAQ3R2Y2_9PEZI|nr:glycine cleavage system t protein [Acrodontium crateriforme]
MSALRANARAVRSIERTLATGRYNQRAFATALPRIQSSQRLSRPVFTTSNGQAVTIRPVQRRMKSSNAEPAPPFFTEAEPGKTALYDLHLQHGGKMVPFGGFSMPVQYSDLSVGESHHWTREKASIFDVGHMVQYHIEGPGAEDFLESITPSGVRDLAPGQSTLSALLLPQTGGISDDCIITRLEAGPKPLFYLVTNAGCRDKDYAYLSQAIASFDGASNPEANIRHVEADGQPYGLIALQGPLAAEILEANLAKDCKVDFKTWYFGNAKTITLALPSGESLPVVASRGGYTGEDGFELSIHPSQTVEVTGHLLTSAGKDKLRLAGLGARDSLRLEAGMCLYGHDLNDTTTPVEAALAWIIPKSRRADAKFPGAEKILAQLKPVSKGGEGVSRRRVGLVIEGAPAREGVEIVDAEGNVIGTVTSGCPSPSLKKNIAMGYVKDGLHKAGTELGVKIRGKTRKATVTKMPFLPAKYVKPQTEP